MNDTERMEKLREPFSLADLEWRIGSSGVTSAGKPWAKVLCYVTNRAIQNRLDEVFGISGWRNDFQSCTIGANPGVSGLLCGISVKTDDGWVTKWDGADPTDVESFKGCISDSQKRAAVQFGIGRYLYDLGESWAEDITEGPAKTDSSKRMFYSKFKDGKFYSWSAPRLPEFAIREGDKTEPVVGTVPKKKEKEESKSRKRVTDAISKCALSGSQKELERISDFADELVRKGDISASEREEINKAVVDSLARIKRQEESPHNPGNKS